MKTKVHEILGVKTGVQFRIKSKDHLGDTRTSYFLDEFGNLRYSMQEYVVQGNYANASELSMAINNGIILQQKYTKEVIEKLRALRTLGFSWLATDSHTGDEHAYVRIPRKGRIIWVPDKCNPHHIRINPPLRITAWDDNKPLSICLAIKEGEAVL